MKALRIATRESALALWQAEHVAAALREAHPGLQVELLPMTTRGDQMQDRPLSTLGGKGLFLKELEVALLEGRAELAVHSMKDVPMELDEGLRIAAVMPRADARDALISPRFRQLAALPPGARVGTSSLRRQCQLQALRPDLQLMDLRGNVNTRLRKLDDGHYDAIILACAGLQRLGLGARITEVLAPPLWIPAAAQGAIGIECVAGNTQMDSLLAALHHAETDRLISAERAMTRHLQGSCEVPIGAWCTLAQPDQLLLYGMVGHRDGRQLRCQLSAAADEPEALGIACARQLLADGAAELLNS